MGKEVDVAYTSVLTIVVKLCQKLSNDVSILVDGFLANSEIGVVIVTESDIELVVSPTFLVLLSIEITFLVVL